MPRNPQVVRLEARDALAGALMALAEHHGVDFDPTRALDAADRIALHGSREALEGMVDLLTGVLRHDDELIAKQRIER